MFNIIDILEARDARASKKTEWNGGGAGKWEILVCRLLTTSTIFVFVTTLAQYFKLPKV